MNREQRKSLVAATVMLLAVFWILFLVSFLAQNPAPKGMEYPLCIDAPEYTCIQLGEEGQYELLPTGVSR